MKTSEQNHIEIAFDVYTVGSQGFCNYIQTHCCGMGLSRTEIERICGVASNSSSFLRVWNDLDWWTDENNATEEESI